jgi:hypothetical protein
MSLNGDSSHITVHLQYPLSAMQEAIYCVVACFSYMTVIWLNQSETDNTDGAVLFNKTLLTWILNGFSYYVLKTLDKYQRVS